MKKPTVANLHDVSLAEVHQIIEDVEGPEPGPIAKWPELEPSALHELAGAAVSLACKNSEADPAAVLGQFLARYGATIGTGPYVRIGDAKHCLRLYVAILGESSKSRKGMSEKPVDRFFSEAEQALKGSQSPIPPLHVYRGGIGSGEGVVYAVRDPSERQDKDGLPLDEGSKEKRLLVIDEELAGTLRAAAREGSTTSAILRQAWDKGDIGTLTKNNPTKATGAHVVVIGHMTIYELLDVLEKREIHNGLANRFLWVGAKRGPLVSWPEPMEKNGVDDIATLLVAAIEHGRKTGEIKPNAVAREYWNDVYVDLAKKDYGGAVGSVTARAEAQIIRLSAHYALLDLKSEIEQGHIEAAKAFWEYCESTAVYAFGSDEGDSVEIQILTALKTKDLTLSAISALFQRHTPATTYRKALQRLETTGKI